MTFSQAYLETQFTEINLYIFRNESSCHSFDSVTETPDSSLVDWVDYVGCTRDPIFENNVFILYNGISRFNCGSDSTCSACSLQFLNDTICRHVVFAGSIDAWVAAGSQFTRVDTQNHNVTQVNWIISQPQLPTSSQSFDPFV